MVSLMLSYLKSNESGLIFFSILNNYDGFIKDFEHCDYPNICQIES